MELNIDTLKKHSNYIIKKFNLCVPRHTYEIGKNKYKVSAEVYLGSRRIVVYPAYHRRHPTDLSVTLLHEYGHLFYGADHGDRFFDYYKFLLNQQRKYFPTELIVPHDYERFRWSRPVGAWVQRWVCGTCSDVKHYKIYKGSSRCPCGAERDLDTNFKTIRFDVV